MNTDTKIENRKAPWNKGKLVGQKLPLKLKEIWAIRIHLQLAKRIRELAMFNLAIDSKLRGCDLVSCRRTPSSGSGAWGRVAVRSCLAGRAGFLSAVRRIRL